MRRLVAIGLVVACLGGGCKRRAPPGPGAPPTGAPLGAGPGRALPGDPPVSVAENRVPLALPATWPKDFPVYPGATLLANQDEPDGGKKGDGLMLMLETRDSPKKVADFYMTSLAHLGKPIFDLPFGAGRSILWNAPGGKTWMVMVMGFGGVTQIELQESD